MTDKIHQTAIIDESAQIGKDVSIGPYSVVEAGVTIGDGCVLDSHVVIGKDTKMGKNNRFFPNCVVGKPPQLLGFDPDEKLGGLVIGDNNIIREMVTIHPSIHPGENTIIGNENLFMIGVHIGHDCVFDNKIVVSNYSQISGHCKIEDGVWLSGMVAVHQFVTFGKWCYAAGFAGVNHDVPPFVIVSGHYPPQVRAVNKRGLSRAGLDEDQQKNIFKAFKTIFKSNGQGVLMERVENLSKEDGLDENVRHMVNSIVRSNQHRFGRYLEQFRH